MTWIIAAISAALKLWSWLTGREKQHEGALKQQVADNEATQKAELEASRAANGVDVDPDYARRVRDRYTDRSG